MTYGFVGLGQMGAPMAKRLVGQDLIVYDTRPEAMESLVAEGARAASKLADLAPASIISLMVRDDAQVEEVVAALLPSASPGTIIAVHSTILASTAITLAERAKPFDVEVVDAPVSGGFMGATDGRLAVMVGGTEAAFERVCEPFGAWADLVLHVGPVGAGTYMKLARNLLHFVSFTAAAEAQRLAEAAGISLRKLGRVVRHSDAVTGGPGAIIFRRTTAPLDPSDPMHETMTHVRDLGEKDLTLALALADELNVATPLARMSRERFAESLGLGDPS